MTGETVEQVKKKIRKSASTGLEDPGIDAIWTH